MKFPPRENRNAEGGSERFFRIKDGESQVFVIRGDVYHFYQKGFGKDSIIVGPGEGGKDRYLTNVILKSDTGYMAKIWEFGTKIYDQISALENAGWDLNVTSFTLSRKGSTKENTSYSLTPNPKPIQAQSLNQIDSVELLNLKHNQPQIEKPKVVESYDPSFDDGPPPFDDNELPF